MIVEIKSAAADDIYIKDEEEECFFLLL